MRLVHTVGLVLLLALQSAASPHTSKFVTVDKDVRLEVLDWGGSGRPVVLLAGGGDTAHVFDDFAPKLIGDYHVFGITRRGFGASGFAAPENIADRLGDDVFAVLEVLNLNRVVLAGHSIAGNELSSMATRHPDRVAGLVYLDALYPYAFDNGTGPSMKELLDLAGPQPPSPTPSDLANFSALSNWNKRILGFTYPEEELRQQWNSSSDGRVATHRDNPGGKMLSALITKGLKKYASIPVPALVLFGNPHGQGTWVDQNTDPQVVQAAKVYSAALAVLTDRQAKAFETAVPAARVVNLAGAHHYVYLSNEADVLREMRSFLSTLR
jgi:non-heme chloroperoxidase